MKNSEKKNSLIKNIGIVMKAWVKNYPSAFILIPVYLFISVANPFLSSLLSSKAIGSITEGNVKNFLITIAILLICISICGGAINIIGSFLQAHRIYTRLKVYAGSLYTKAICTDYQNVELQKNQKILGKATNSLSSNWNGPEQLMNMTLNITVTILGIGSYGTVILMIDWKILVAVLLMFVCDITLQSLAIKYNDKHREESSEIWRKSNYIKDKSMNIAAGKDIRIYQLKDWFNSLLGKLIKERREYEKRSNLRWYFPTVADCIINFFRDILAYSILIKRVLNGEIDAATFTLYIGMIGSFSNWIYSLAGNFSQLKRSSHEFNDYFEFMKLPERIRNEEIQIRNEKLGIRNCGKRVDDVELGEDVCTGRKFGAPEIEFRDVAFCYDGSEKNTLEGLNFTIHKGEKIALVGNNGAGKTTIVKLLTGLYEQTGGQILVDGKSIDEIGLSDYQDNISVLFQDTNPLGFTIEENVASSELEKIDSDKVSEALKKAGLLDKIISLKNKEKTYITQNLDDEGVLLSGGETQKLLLAKAIYKNGNFLILDEPTSALDPLAESKIYEEYNNMADGKTAVFISHRLASTKFCDKIMFLEGGKIAEFGTHDELMKKGGKYKEMFEIQSQYYVK